MNAANQEWPDPPWRPKVIGSVCFDRVAQPLLHPGLAEFVAVARKLEGTIDDGPWRLVGNPSHGMRITCEGNVARDVGIPATAPQEAAVLADLQHLNAWSSEIGQCEAAQEWQRALARTADLQATLKTHLQRLAGSTGYRRDRCDKDCEPF